MYKSTIWCFILACFLVLSYGCAPMNESFESDASIKISKKLLRVDSITKVLVFVTGEGIGETIEQALLQKDGQWQGLVSQIPAGNNRTFSAVAYDASGQVLFSGKASNVELLPGKTAGVLITLQQKTPPKPFLNTVPVLDSVTTTSLQVRPEQSVQLRVKAHDDDANDTLSYSWSAQAGSFSSSSSVSPLWTAPSQTGRFRITITVRDKRSAMVVVSLNIDVVNDNSATANVTADFNTWPSIQSMYAEGFAKENKLLSLLVVAGDLDGDSLTYQWSVEGAGCNGQFNSTTSASPSWTLPSSLDKGTKCSFNVLVKDGRGGESKGVIAIYPENNVKVEVVPTNSVDTTPPTSTVDPSSGLVVRFDQVNITCEDKGTGCKRIVYTTDGSTPSFDPPNGTIVNDSIATIELIFLGSFDTLPLRFASEDKAGNRETPQAMTLTSY